MNRSERRIALTAIVVITLALIALLWLPTGETTEPYAERLSKDSTTHYGKRSYGKQHNSATAAMTIGDVPMPHAEEFPFDPNTADSTELLRLGLQRWLVRTIYRYRAHGGVFRTKSDFAKLHGLLRKDYLRLEPYIRISDDYQPAATLFPQEQRDTLRRPVKLKDGEHIALNTADTSQLMKVPGIGTYYAKEIVRHGKWLGGYVSVDQLDEIDGFPTSAKKYFVIEHPAPQRLNINKLSLQELRRHPYINYYQAKTIVDYRRLHGDIKSLRELRFSNDFTEAAITRLEPYVEY